MNNQHAPLKIIIFDLDGTLLNTIDDLGYACNHALAAEGLPVHPIEEYPRLVGNGVRRLVERALQNPSSELVDRVLTHFIPYYNDHNCDYTKPYEGTSELLKTLKEKGFRLAVASNKYQEATEKIVAHFFPGIFDLVLGERDGVPRKPDPQIVKDILRTLDPAYTTNHPFVLYIGDSLVDMQTAQNAQLPFVACSWGFVPRQKLVEAGCKHIIDKPAELLKY